VVLQGDLELIHLLDVKRGVCSATYGSRYRAGRITFFVGAVPGGRLVPWRRLNYASGKTLLPHHGNFPQMSVAPIQSTFNPGS